MHCTQLLESYLQDNEIAYEVRHHPQAFTARQVAESEQLPRNEMAKVVLVIADGEMLMLVLPSNQRVYLPAVAELTSAHVVRLAEEWEFAPVFSGCEAGAMPPFGNIFDLPVYVDKMLTEDEIIYFQAGTHTETMSLNYADFERLVRPVVGDFSWEEAAVEYTR